MNIQTEYTIYKLNVMQVYPDKSNSWIIDITKQTIETT